MRFKPESLDTLVKLTKFNKRELKLMYRGFKQVSARGRRQFAALIAQGKQKIARPEMGANRQTNLPASPRPNTLKSSVRLEW